MIFYRYIKNVVYCAAPPHADIQSMNNYVRSAYPDGSGHAGGKLYDVGTLFRQAGGNMSSLLGVSGNSEHFTPAVPQTLEAIREAYPEA